MYREIGRRLGVSVQRDKGGARGECQRDQGGG